MIIDHLKQYVYIAIPKTASKSISCTLGQLAHPEPPLYHMGISEVLELYPDVADYFHWSIVRNPFARLASCYFDFTLIRINQYSQQIAYSEPLLSEFESFHDFCLNLKYSKWSDDIFFKPQIDFLLRPDGSLVDFVGRQENLIEDFQKVCTQLSLGNIALLHVNQGQYNGKWKDYYLDEEQVNAVRDLYRIDFDTFGYDCTI